jgi:hypothetical protein
LAGLNLRSRLGLGLLLAFIVAAATGRPADAQTAAGTSRALLNFQPLEPITLARAADDGSPAGSGRLRGSFFAYGRTFELELEPNDLFDPESVDAWVGDNGAATSSPAAAYYKGRVAGDAKSWVRVRHRDGVLDGLVRTGDGIYFIEPASRFSPTPSPWAMVMYRLSAAPAVALPAVGRTLNMGLIADYEYYRRHGDDSAADIQNIVNQVDGLLREELGVAVRIGRTVVYTTANDPFSSTTVPDSLLNEVAFFKAGEEDAMSSFGLVHLFTGRAMDRNKVGLAYMGAVCDPAYGSVFSQDFSTLNKDAVLLAAHEIAHALGAPHDGEPGSSCALEPAGYAMYPDSRQEPGLQFSECSKNAMNSVLAAARCLLPDN